MSERDLTPLFERMKSPEAPPESASAREERRRRVIGNMRRLHVNLVHERGRGVNVKRLSRVVLIAATLAVAGAAFASVEGYGPFARARSSPGIDEKAATLRASAERTQASVPAAPAAPNTSNTPLPAPEARPTSASAAATAPAHSAHATSTSARRDETSTLEATNRLFADAKRARREGRNADALALLDQLVSKYPRSVLAQEARVERYRALSKLGRTAEARRAAAAYLAHYPNGFAASEARELSGGTSAP